MNTQDETQVRTSVSKQVTAPPYRARDDYIFMWPGEVATIDLLTNDDHPAGAQAQLYSSTVIGKGGVVFNGDGSATVTRDEISRFDTIRYSFVDSAGTTNQAKIDVEFLEGTPGLDITNSIFLPDQSAQSGVLKYDLRLIFDQFGNYGTKVTSVSATFGGNDVTGITNPDGSVSIDFAQFDDYDYFTSQTLTLSAVTELPDGRTGGGQIMVSVDPGNAVDSGVSIGQNSSGIYAGTTDNDTIYARSNQMELLFGGGGADKFVFADTSSNNQNDLDVVLDYGITGDEISFETETAVSGIVEVHDGVILLINGGEDTIFVSGQGLEFSELELENWAVATANPNDQQNTNGDEVLEDLIGGILVTSYLQHLNLNLAFYGNFAGVPTYSFY